MPIGFTIIAINSCRNIAQTTATGPVLWRGDGDGSEVSSEAVKTHQLSLVITASFCRSAM